MSFFQFPRLAVFASQAELRRCRGGHVVTMAFLVLSTFAFSDTASAGLLHRLCSRSNGGNACCGSTDCFQANPCLQTSYACQPAVNCAPIPMVTCPAPAPVVIESSCCTTTPVCAPVITSTTIVTPTRVCCPPIAPARNVCCPRFTAQLRPCCPPRRCPPISTTRCCQSTTSLSCNPHPPIFAHRGCASRGCASRGCASRGCASRGCASRGCASRGCASRGCASRGCASRGCASRCGMRSGCGGGTRCGSRCGGSVGYGYVTSQRALAPLAFQPAFALANAKINAGTESRVKPVQVAVQLKFTPSQSLSHPSRKSETPESEVATQSKPDNQASVESARSVNGSTALTFF